MSRTLFVLCLLTTACKATESTEKVSRYDGASFTRLDVRSIAGSVAVKVGTSGVVNSVLHWSGTVQPTISSRLAGETLIVSSDCPLKSKACSVDFEITVPEGVAVTLEQDDGDLEIHDVQGDVDIVAYHGAVSLIDVGGDVRVNSDRVDLTLDGVTGRFDIAATRGEVVGQALTSPTGSVTADRGIVDLAFTGQPDLVDITTETSDITLSLPKGDYDVDAVSRRGNTTTEGLTSTVDAGSVILAHSTRGNITVSGR